MTDFKIKMAELAAKYNISHKRDIDWHNFVAEVEELTHYTKRNELFDQCVANCDPKVMQEVSDKVDEWTIKQKAIIDELKNRYEKDPDDNRDIVDVGKLIHNRRKKEDER